MAPVWQAVNVHFRATCLHLDTIVPPVSLKLGKVNVVDNSTSVGVLAFNIEGEGAAAEA